VSAEIAGTRRELSRDVEELYDKVSPSRVIGRRKASMRGRATSLKDKVMGSAHSGAHSAAGTARGAAGAVSDNASGAARAVEGAAQSTVHAVETRTQGSPLAAGLVAFGAGMVVSSLIPASRAETEAARRLSQAAEEHGVADEMKAVGQDVAESIKESAAGAVDEMRSTVQESAQTVTDEGRASVRQVRDDAPGI
jgi:uncharacterized protein YjbJ (UPF0337 family)